MRKRKVDDGGFDYAAVDEILFRIIVYTVLTLICVAFWWFVAMGWCWVKNLL